MSECSTDKKCRALFIASIAANIFLVAFILGRATPYALPPLPPDHPPPFQEGMGPPGPPPTFGMRDLYNPKELRVEEEHVHEYFSKMNKLRNDFAMRLQEGPISKEEVLKHFTVFDSVLENIEDETRGSAAEKISLMSEQERKNLASKLLSQGDMRNYRPDRPPFNDVRPGSP